MILVFTLMFPLYSVIILYIHKGEIFIQTLGQTNGVWGVGGGVRDHRQSLFVWEDSPLYHIIVNHKCGSKKIKWSDPSLEIHFKGSPLFELFNQLLFHSYK